jgi:PAS domain S-box-containing protein
MTSGFTPLASASPARKPAQWWSNWWNRQPSARQDRLASLAPLGAVLLFLCAIASAFVYLRLEEIERERETVIRDVEYGQQRLRLRLIERQEQLTRIARDTVSKEIDPEEFINRAESLVNQSPDIQSITWLDARRRVRASYASPTVPDSQLKLAGKELQDSDTEGGYALARDLLQPVFLQNPPDIDGNGPLELHIPMSDRGRFIGVILCEFSLDSLLRLAVPPEISSRYALSLVDGTGKLLAGHQPTKRQRTSITPWFTPAIMAEAAVPPVGNGLVLQAQAWRTSQGVVGTGLFWLVGVLSAMTAWMLIGNWRHTRRRMQAQQALLTETHFRRAMENSMLTGMRALDMQGRITYVNPAFCRMTGWTEAELLGRTAPFPYWPDEDQVALAARLDDELQGRTTAGGFQVRVKRRDGVLFDARMYVSPLVDPAGQQTGWMTSMTDITEPNRIRQQLSASYERFTTVLEALDAAVSVAPMGNEELLFANRLYRLWFGARADGHRLMLTSAGATQPGPQVESRDDVDSLAGLPIDLFTIEQTERAEVFVAELDKWLEVRTRHLNWVDGRLAQMVIATNITAGRRAEELAAQQAEKAQSASRLITMGEMASSVAHELNQPLTAINNYCKGMISRMEAGRLDNEQFKDALEKTARQAHRAGQIIQRIRAFVKRSEPNRAWTDVHVIVGEALELAEIDFKRRSIRLSRYVAPRLPKVWVDPILIEQVLINLIKNGADSIDASARPHGRRHIELRVTAERLEAGPSVRFEVSDTGQGLPPEVKARLYEAFFSTKVEGMGIGLSLCRSIIESHQGRIEAENLYNAADVVGCRFTFWLPQLSQPADPSDDIPPYPVQSR